MRPDAHYLAELATPVTVTLSMATWNALLGCIDLALYETTGIHERSRPRVQTAREMIYQATEAARQGLPA